MKKYVAHKYSNRISAAEVQRETAQYVVRKNSQGRAIREAKSSEFSVYCDSWQAAKDVLVDYCRREVASAKERLAQAEALEQPKERV